MDVFDIVYRLRERAAHVTELEGIGEQMPNGLVKVLTDAAAEIDKLRAQAIALEGELERLETKYIVLKELH